VIHILENEDNPDKMEPPIQTENLLSGGATTLTFMAAGAKFYTSLVNLSAIP